MDKAIVRTFDNPVLAHMSSDQLTNAGIENFIFDENTNTVLPFLNIASGGIKIVVRKEDEQKALAALADIDQAYRKAAVCPKCGAKEIVLVPKNSKGNVLTGIFTWLFSNQALAVENVYQCNHCGYESETLPEPPEGYTDNDLL